MKKYIIVILSILIILAGAGGFFGGMKYAQSKRGQFGMGGDNARFAQARQNGGNLNRANMVNGEIIKADETSITVKMADGGSKIIYISETTEVAKTVDGVKSDLEVGKNVMINGTTNNDGSVAAQSVQIRTEAIPFGGPDADLPVQD
ncbi:MAG: hypothetical protein PHW53_03615 [Patescibacteria group bacterium]|nr:hypothetical protein [Patescibacteria group bacterium]